MRFHGTCRQEMQTKKQLDTHGESGDIGTSIETDKLRQTHTQSDTESDIDPDRRITQGHDHRLSESRHIDADHAGMDPGY